MRVALVHDFFTQWGGGERVLKVFTEMFPEAPVYLIAKNQQLVDEFLPGVDVRASFIQKLPGIPNSFKYYLAFMPKAIESFDLSQYDLVLSDSSAYAKGAITRPPTKHVCYLHTPTRYLTSDREEYLANAPIPLPLIGRPVVRAITKYLAKWDLAASRRPDAIIANSEYIAERTRRYYHRNPDVVIWPPVDTERFKIAPKVGDYWLVIARAEPYKRTDLAIEAANQLGLKLKIVGGGTKLEALKKIAGPTVEFTGRVSDEALADLYAQAIGFIHPQKEDAGMTALESMASGRPVIAYGEGGALESVVPGVTGEHFPEQTVDSLVGVLKQFKAERYDPHKIREHAKQFDAELFKQKIRAVIDQTIGQK